MTNAIDIEHLQQWIGKSQTRTDSVCAAPVAGLHATLDHPEQKILSGYALPALWHWLYFLPIDRQSNIDNSGHAKLGDFMPPVPLPRRMWAGSQLDFQHRICVGDTIERTSTINNVTHKTGKSGELVFVQVKHQINVIASHDQPAQTSSANQTTENLTNIESEESQRIQAITEYHDIVYRAPAQNNRPATTSVTQSKAAPKLSDWERRIETNDVQLFRYSALTFNGHRIHYDRRYVIEVEGYPGLIVHGPLIATLLLDTLHKEISDAAVIHYEFKAIKPIFDTHPFFVCGAVSINENNETSLQNDTSTVQLWAKDHLGDIAMLATAIIRKTNIA